MLKLLLKPGIQIISRLSLAKKFIFIFMLYLVPVGYVAFYTVTKHSKQVTATQQEIQHLKLINIFKPVFVNMAQSRGLTNALLNGNKAVIHKIANAQTKVDSQLNTISNLASFMQLKKADRLFYRS